MKKSWEKRFIFRPNLAPFTQLWEKNKFQQKSTYNKFEYSWFPISTQKTLKNLKDFEKKAGRFLSSSWHFSINFFFFDLKEL